MDLLPSLSLEIYNAFWFSLLFIATNIIVLKISPKHYKQRVLQFPKQQKTVHKLVSMINFMLFQGLILLVIFVPVRFHTPCFLPGLIIFLLGYLAYLTSLLNYASSNPEKPVTKGIYHYSRNPQQLATIVMWIGIGFITACCLIIIISLIQLITMYPTFLAQEQSCIRQYGEAYKKYMQKTPRYFVKLKIMF